MPWQQLHIVSTRDQAEMVEDLLLASGAVSVTMTDDADNPILEPGVGETPLWETVKVTGLYAADVERQNIIDQLPLPTEQLLWETLEDQPWERAWMDQFQPIPCGQRLWVCPSWLEPPDPQAVNLILDPGLAFGSGTHPTTVLCLQWLDAQPLDGATVVDYGCGSGILGIAALLLGAQKVIAIDNDPQALLATRDNLQRNGLADDRLDTWLPGDLPGLQADIVVANILAAPLIALATTITDILRPGGRLALSGIMTHQTDTVAAAYPQIHFDPAATREEWARLNGNKRPLE